MTLRSDSLITRYAPSPTGHLHLGHVAHMLYVWGVAGLLGARVLLRIEDHDRQRCRPEYEQSLLEDLDWLGFAAENTVTAPSPFRQSDSGAAYQEALARLTGAGLVYRCTCSRKEIAEHAIRKTGGERRYNGRCRDRAHPGAAPHCLRVRIDPGEETFFDAVLGEQRQDPSRQCGDLVLRDRHGQWSYQLAVTVDDLRHSVNLVIRGADLLASTGRQLRLAKLLGRAEPPLYFHHPLITGPRGQKLSKRDGATGMRELRMQGMSAREVLGLAAFRAGLTRTCGELSTSDAARVVDRAHPGLNERLRARSASR